MYYDNYMNAQANLRRLLSQNYPVYHKGTAHSLKETLLILCFNFITHNKAPYSFCMDF